MLKRVTRKIGDVRTQHVAVRKRWFWASTALMFAVVVAGWALTMRFTLEEFSQPQQASVQSSGDTNIAEFWSSLKGNMGMLSGKVEGSMSLVSQMLGAGVGAVAGSGASEAATPSPSPAAAAAGPVQAEAAHPILPDSSAQ